MSLARDICFIFWGAVGRAVGNFSPGAPYCTSSLLESFISGSGDICHPLCTRGSDKIREHWGSDWRQAR